MALAHTTRENVSNSQATPQMSSKAAELDPVISTTFYGGEKRNSLMVESIKKKGGGFTPSF